MSKKLLVVFVVILAGLSLATTARSGDLGDEALATLQHLTNGSGNTAGLILNPEGKGDVLIFPYYDVREIFGKAQDFFFYIICSDDWDAAEGIYSTQTYNGVAMKLRFREWDKSEEVFDVDIWCSKGDVWVGQVTHNTAIALPYGAKIFSQDYVIINSDGANFTLSKALSAGFDFPQTAFIPPGSSNLMGYIEVIGEERTYDKVWTTSPDIKVSRLNITGCTGGGLVNCTADVPNELVGFAYFIRVADGQAMAYNATAIANFNGENALDSARTLFQQPGGTLPQLTQAEDGLQALEFQISKESVWAAYSVESVINGNFSFILTFPTKHFHFCPKPNYTAVGPGPCGINGGIPTMPWTVSDSFQGVHHANTPEAIVIDIWDRNENRVTPPPCFVSPCPTGTTGLPYEVNVIGLYQGSTPSVPAVNNRNNVAYSTTTFDSGWVKIEFCNVLTGTCNGATYVGLGKFFNFGTFYGWYEGLPLLALSLQEYSNNSVGGWYGDIRPAWYESEWEDRIFP